jgi:hypothetical protein
MGKNEAAMAGAGVLLKVGLPLLLAGGGVAAFITAPSDAAIPVADVWIDSPSDGVLLSAGSVVVVAHATAGSGISSLSLEVDGSIVSSTSDLDSFDTLVSATLPWIATDGPHQLVVTGGDQRSEPVVVHVGQPTEVPSASLPTPLTLPSSSSSTSSTSSSTTSTTLPETTTTTTVPVTTPPATPPPVTAVPAPTISNVSLTPSPGTVLRCDGDFVRVTASVTDATSGQMQIYRTANNLLFETVNGTVSGGVFTATRDGATPGKIPAMEYYVTLTVSGPGGSDETNAGPLTSSCLTKD